MPRQKKQRLKKRADGRYCCKYQGVQFMGETEDEALQKREDYKKGLSVRRSSYTLGSYAEYWLPINKKSVKASTYNAYTSILNTVCHPISNVYLSSLTSDHVNEALSNLSGKSASYIHKARILLTEILDSAVDAGYLLKNPVRAQSVKPPKGTKGTHRAITKSERTRIEKTQHRMQLAALIMLYCGLRRGELLGLKAEDIMGEDLTVRRAVYYVSNQPQISEPKTANGIRTVPCPDFVLKMLPMMDRDCYILTGTQKPMTEMVFTRAWSNYQKAIGSNVRCHDLRHSYCTWLRDSGVDIHQAIIWMGHADEKLILRIYDHPGSTREKQAIKLLNTALRMQIGMQKQIKSLGALQEYSPTQTA